MIGRLNAFARQLLRLDCMAYVDSFGKVIGFGKYSRTSHQTLVAYWLGIAVSVLGGAVASALDCAKICPQQSLPTTTLW